ncbi:MAG: acyl carrier protein [Myxococcaceae bacterium]
MEHTQKLREFITTNFYVAEPAALKDDQSLLESGVVDSTGVLEIVQFLESDFGVKVEDTEIVPENVDTISRLSAFIARKKK